MSPIPIVLDCDPGHDDAIALLLALASPELELVGVTTVAGNQTLEKTTANALRLLEFAGRGDIPVAAGADRPLVREPAVAADVHGETGLDGPELPPPQGTAVGEDAVEFLAERVERGAVVVATGPLTNVARLLERARPRRIVLMGGSIGEGNRTPAAEFNVWCDPEAARLVFRSGIETTMIGLDATHQAVVTDADVEQLRPLGRTGKLVAELLDFYGRFHRARYPELAGSPLHDPVAVAHVARPGLVEVRPASIEVDCESEQSRGRTNVDRRGRGPATPGVSVAVGVDAAAFRRLLVERLPSLG
ncbi:MAG TPA: nucleoside hydrolase [Gaiellaceae bacterium]|nr:nucleoside hydrolase [Gaiellaceae bacterium]